MKIVAYSCKPYDQEFLKKFFKETWQTNHIETSLSLDTISYAKGAEIVSVFVNDQLDDLILKTLANGGTKLIALRCAGFDNVDLQAAKKYGLRVVRVPKYSPYAVAEHTIALMLALNRKLYRSYNRVREGNFSLNGMLGFDMHGKTVGIIGAGNIGCLVANVLKAFGCQVLIYDPYCNDAEKKLGIEQTSLDNIYTDADIISLHCPLTDETTHMINQDSLAKMKNGVMLINTGRGALMEPCSLIQGLKSKKIGYLGMDVYEKEAQLFFEDRSCEIIQDDTFERLLTFPNVLITGHQGYFTEEALLHIAETTANNITEYLQLIEQPDKLQNEVV